MGSNKKNRAFVRCSIRPSTVRRLQLERARKINALKRTNFRAMSTELTLFGKVSVQMIALPLTVALKLPLGQEWRQRTPSHLCWLWKSSCHSASPINNLEDRLQSLVTTCHKTFKASGPWSSPHPSLSSASQTRTTNSGPRSIML